MSGLIDRTPSAYSYPLLLKQLLHTPLAWSPGQEIVYRDLVRHDYRTFVARIGRLANGLASLGVLPGSTVAVMDWDSHRYLECFFAIPMMGAVLHTVNVRLSPEQLLYTIEHAEDEVILVNADFLPLLEAIKGRLGKVRSFVLISDTPQAPPSALPFAAEYEQLLAGCSPDFTFPDMDENTRATTFYTTGTTGLPKGVYFSHRQLVLHTLGLAAGLGSAAGHGRFHCGDVYMPLTPMFHVHAWGVPLLATLLGVKQVYPGRYEPEMLLHLLVREKVTFSHCVPTILQMLVSSPAARAVDLSCWKVVIGGAALPTSLAKAALKLGIDVFAGYGLSESCPLLSLAHLTPEMHEWEGDKQAEMRCRAGRPSPLVELQVVDENLQEVARDGAALGEIVVRAPWLTQGYLKDASASEALWRGGYMHTGDLASVDAYGYVRISDRLKDVIKSGGEWVSSLELEDLIGRHPAVAQVAVIGVPDEHWGERPVAIVVARPDAHESVTAEAIRAHVETFVAAGVIRSWAVPDRVVFVAEIPKTGVGKIDKRVLREQVRASTRA
jgi:fatty-acyl-CoA synthase